uniref:Rab-GAP TBC domain-containing protein n=1 Tax=Acrobeloides nanus TaxID=290746 RepID=A0A914EL90_9BILA
MAPARMSIIFSTRKALMSSTISDLVRKAHGAIAHLRGANNLFFGKDGEIVYSKNNVCVHERPNNTEEIDDEDNAIHTPGYLTVHVLTDEQTGVSLVLQWLPNTTLEKNPASIRCISPRSQNRDQNATSRSTENSKGETDDENEESSCTTLPSGDDYSHASTEICAEMNDDIIIVTNSDRPQSLSTKMNNYLSSQGAGGLGVPDINIIPNTPVDPRMLTEDEIDRKDVISESSSGATSGADEYSDKEDLVQSSSCDESDEETRRRKSISIENYRRNFQNIMSNTTPEQFAKEHNLILDSGGKEGDETSMMLAMAKERVIFQQRPSNASLFSVNLGKMRSMRIFYSNVECTSGQLVIASPDSQYKILHFHHGGLDKLGQLFEQWNAIKSRSVKEDSPSPFPDKHLLICHPELNRSELDPEDGLYDRLSWELWRSYKNQDGSIDDSFTIRKTVYFASMDPSLRKEVWPFLLRVYPWSSTFEQRETRRNDLFLEYQRIKKRRLKKANSSNMKEMFAAIESMVVKDVVRTDRKNPFYAGDDNPNIEIMRDILLNYAFMNPEINYIQGMSDLLAPLLSTLQNEADTYWCFVGLIQQTLFCSAPTEENNMMDVNLGYLRELLKLLNPKFYKYLALLGGDALQLMFVHRWILLCFKREFPDIDALHIWEACWARYRTSYFHLFVCVAITSIYGQDLIEQNLPHDEILLYFASLAMHMDAKVVLKKARGLLYQFYRLERIPCTLAGLCVHDAASEQWSSHVPPQTFECVKIHGNNEPCPFANID